MTKRCMELNKIVKQLEYVHIKCKMYVENSARETYEVDN